MPGLGHTAKRSSTSLSVYQLYFAVCGVLAHGKVALCRPLYAVRGLSCVTHGKYFAVCKPAFAVCLWHTANDLRPVVDYIELKFNLD